MVKRLIVLSLAALVLTCSGGTRIARAAGGENSWEGKRAPVFSLKDLEGKDLRLADFSGKKVVWLNFWGLRCGPCVRELPALEKLYAKYAPKGLVIIGINTDGVDAALIKKQFSERADLKSAGITFPLAPDPEFKVIDSYGLMGAPLNVMIDKKGVIRFHHEGYEEGDEANYAKSVEKLLAE